MPSASPHQAEQLFHSQTDVGGMVPESTRLTTDGCPVTINVEFADMVPLRFNFPIRFRSTGIVTLVLLTNRDKARH